MAGRLPGTSPAGQAPGRAGADPLGRAGPEDSHLECAGDRGADPTLPARGRAVHGSLGTRLGLQRLRRIRRGGVLPERARAAVLDERPGLRTDADLPDEARLPAFTTRA